jgi:signal transduction histidine kinase
MEFVDLAALTIHDVKNRLAILAGRAESRGDAQTLHEVLEAASTLSRLLLFYKSEKGRLDADIDARVPADLLTEVAAEIGRRTSLTVEVATQSASMLCFYDENLVRLVLLDALYNAVRYARQRIALTAFESGEWLVFQVADDGDGFPPALLAGGADMQPWSAEGTGLGLHLASRVASLHRNGEKCGHVALHNEGGAVFSLYLPK